MYLASRISVNLEAPNTSRLQQLAPKKEFTEELLAPLIWAEDIRKNKAPHRTWNGRWPSTVTQFVVGAVGESDLELIATSEKLYKNLSLQRAYYSAFRPIKDTPLDHLPAENPLRQHRLYQSSFLLRDYGFSLEDIPFDANGNLPLDMDPKLAWAQENLIQQPIEINQADAEVLLRIPGIGPKSVQTIIKARKQSKIREVTQLKKLGVITKKAVDFILLDGKTPNRQLQLL